MTVIECDNKDCYYNENGFCESEVVEIRDGRCITLEIDEEIACI